MSSIKLPGSFKVHETSSMKSESYDIIEENHLIDEQEYADLVEQAQLVLAEELATRSTWATLDFDTFNKLLHSLYNHWLKKKIWECDVVPRPVESSVAHPDRIMDAASDVRETLKDELACRADRIIIHARKVMLKSTCVEIRVYRQGIELVDVYSLEAAQRKNKIG